MEEELKGLNLVDLYDKLIQPEAPVPISLWPQTVGWLWLGAAVVILSALAFWRWRAWRQASAYRRAALVALKDAGEDPAAIADVLRRAALCGFPRAQVAQLYGADWLAFLDGVAQGTRFGTSDAGRALAAAPYRPQAPQPDLPAMAETWIRTHRQEANS